MHASSQANGLLLRLARCSVRMVASDACLGGSLAQTYTVLPVTVLKLSQVRVLKLIVSYALHLRRYRTFQRRSQEKLWFEFDVACTCKLDPLKSLGLAGPTCGRPTIKPPHAL